MAGIGLLILKLVALSYLCLKVWALKSNQTITKQMKVHRGRKGQTGVWIGNAVTYRHLIVALGILSATQVRLTACAFQLQIGMVGIFSKVGLN